MYSRPSLILRSTALVALAAAAISVATPAASGSRDRDFFEQVAGSWSGPGEIVAGKYKGTKFTCDLSGETAKATETGITLDGFCRVGVFKQPMKAVIAKTAKGYGGTFLDGAEGKGLDIVSGKVSSDRVVVGINRKKLNGAMIARLHGVNSMNITISVKVEKTMVPVIGVSLNRKVDEIAVGSIK